MATYTEFHQPEIPSDRQDVSISQILDHGSISFGRFDVESLAWEKRSVFRHNRCQEELEMYKSNGLVAQKKAYFEEYYKKVRALKAMQAAEHQEARQPDPCHDVKINSLELENENCDDLSNEGNSGNDTVVNSDSGNQEELGECNDNADKVIVTDESSNAICAEPEQATVGASSSPRPSVSRSSRASQHHSIVSDPVKNDANKPKKRVPPVLKAKGNAPLPRSKSKVDCKITKDAVKPSDKSRPRPLHHSISKRDNNILPGKCNTCRAASENNSSRVSSRKQLTEVCSSATVPLSSSTRSRLVSSSPSVRSDIKKETSNGKDLADRLLIYRPVHARSVQNLSKEKPIPGGLKNTAIENRSCIGVSRKPSDLGNQQMRPKVGHSENQRPKSRLTNIPAQIKLDQKLVGFERKNRGKEGKEKEGKEESNATHRKYPKSASTVASTVQKNVKLVQKIAESRSGVILRA